MLLGVIREVIISGLYCLGVFPAAQDESVRLSLSEELFDSLEALLKLLVKVHADEYGESLTRPEDAPVATTVFAIAAMVGLLF
jgi:hypothetical protein